MKILFRPGLNIVIATFFAVLAAPAAGQTVYKPTHYDCIEDFQDPDDRYYYVYVHQPEAAYIRGVDNAYAKYTFSIPGTLSWSDYLDYSCFQDGDGVCLPDNSRYPLAMQLSVKFLPERFYAYGRGEVDFGLFYSVDDGSSWSIMTEQHFDSTHWGGISDISTVSAQISSNDLAHLVVRFTIEIDPGEDPRSQPNMGWYDIFDIKAEAIIRPMSQPSFFGL